MPSPNNRWPLAALVVLLLAAPGPLGAQVSLFPDVEAFEYPIGAARATGIVGRLLSVSRGESRYGAEREAEATIGEVVPVLGFGSGATRVHLDLGVRVTGRFSLDDPRSALVSNDWYVGIQSVVATRSAALALELYHESSHLGDEYAERFLVRRLDWTREVAALWLRLGGGPLRVHATGSWALIDELDLPNGGAGVGLDWRGSAGRALGTRVMPVLGVFAESVEYADWKVTTSARAGIELGERNRRVGVSLVYLNGLSTQRQFFRERSRYLGAELRFEF
jgi:hypothetical protein